MSYFALIKNGIVENTIIADLDFINSLPNASDYVEYTNAGIGWSYDGVNFIPPKFTCGHNELTFNETTFNWVCTNSAHEVRMA